MGFTDWSRAKEFYSSTLIVGMVSFVLILGFGRELLATGLFIVTMVLAGASNKIFEGSVFDERDVTLAQDSARKSLMLTGVLGGIGSIVIFVGMGLEMWRYPQWVIPVYFTWGGFVLLSIVIESLQIFGVDI